MQPLQHLELSRLYQRVAHRAAHSLKPCESCGIVKEVKSEDVRDDDLIEKARDRSLGVTMHGCIGENGSGGSIAHVGGHGGEW